MQQDPEALEQKTIVGWNSLDDEPGFQEHERLGLFTDYNCEKKTVSFSCEAIGLAKTTVPLEDFEQLELLPWQEDKLAGWPAWKASLQAAGRTTVWLPSPRGGSTRSSLWTERSRAPTAAA